MAAPNNCVNHAEANSIQNYQIKTRNINYEHYKSLQTYLNVKTFNFYFKSKI